MVSAALAVGLVTGFAQPPQASVQTPVPVAHSTTLDSTPAAAKPARTTLLDEAHHQLTAMRHSRYQHKTEVNEQEGKYFYDCSGFLDYALERSKPNALQALHVNARSKRPLAEDFVHHLQKAGKGGTGGPWQSVGTVAELRPGNVIAWLTAPDSDTDNTGHVMVVDGRPVQNPQRPNEWLVKIIDSTKSPHADDSRAKGTTGLGTGTVGLIVNRSGEPVGYYWRGGVSTVAKHTEVALGRVS
ncbi:hypothetical protein [Pseudonocardia aurantiaca]|uniref:Peptidase C51 domain-containing protein n=1 Tax=Pseudonocardia aurantiaca TaxID=75290 RepID=A0ABW4FBM6_9PSEU